ncbi:hypothetical protein HPB51_019771 [Rhipicephalus microplus]|uniref:Uncharacterized protein n=1 Tax=Rhipicephalus microplus TaxID=6941 RepID=A0A9J6DCC3_RHIMP|nr:hypothetical protein HPB51_019771 [Rhipicephalus microplus]
MVERALEQLKKDNAAKEEQRGNGDSKPKEREEETNGGVTGSPEDNGGVSKERNSLPEPMDRSSFPPCAPTGGQHQTEASAVSKEEEDNDDEERGSGPPPATSQESLTEDTQQQASRGSTTAPTQQQQQQPPSTSWKVRTLQKAETLSLVAHSLILGFGCFVPLVLPPQISFEVTIVKSAEMISDVLQGKHKPIFSPTSDCGDHVVVTNCSEITMPWYECVVYQGMVHNGEGPTTEHETQRAPACAPDTRSRKDHGARPLQHFDWSLEGAKDPDALLGEVLQVDYSFGQAVLFAEMTLSLLQSSRIQTLLYPPVVAG